MVNAPSLATTVVSSFSRKFLIWNMPFPFSLRSRARSRQRSHAGQFQYTVRARSGQALGRWRLAAADWRRVPGIQLGAEE